MAHEVAVGDCAASYMEICNCKMIKAKATKQMTVQELEVWYTVQQKLRRFKEPLALNDCTVIKDVWQFAKTHLRYLKANAGNAAYLPYYDRLVQVRNIFLASQTKTKTHAKSQPNQSQK